MAQKLSRRKKIDPTVHSVEAVTAIVVGNTVDLLIRQNIERVPLGKVLRQPRDDFCAVVILRTGRSVASFPFWLAKLPGLQTSLDPTLVGHGEELISHFARLGLALYLIVTYDAFAIGERASGVAVRNSTRGLLRRRPDDLEGTDAPGSAWIAREVRLNSHYSDPQFLAALEAVLEVLPPSRNFVGFDVATGDAKSATDDFDALEKLRRLAFVDKVDEPQQLSLFAEEAA